MIPTIPVTTPMLIVDTLLVSGAMRREETTLILIPVQNAATKKMRGLAWGL
jgi:hypothetical protein